jgi:hypothetical protein
MLMGWDYVSEMWSPMGLSLIPQMIYVYGVSQWNDIDRANWRTQRKTCIITSLFNTNPTWADPGVNPGLHIEGPATNRLSHGAAY